MGRLMSIFMSATERAAGVIDLSLLLERLAGQKSPKASATASPATNPDLTDMMSPLCEGGQAHPPTNRLRAGANAASLEPMSGVNVIEVFASERRLAHARVSKTRIESYASSLTGGVEL